MHFALFGKHWPFVLYKLEYQVAGFRGDCACKGGDIVRRGAFELTISKLQCQNPDSYEKEYCGLFHACKSRANVRMKRFRVEVGRFRRRGVDFRCPETGLEDLSGDRKRVKSRGWGSADM